MNHLTHSLEERKALMIQKAKNIHGDKYDYSKVVYTKAAAKVEIVCKIHGSFWQSLDSHTSRGVGCPSCGRDKLRNSGVFGKLKTNTEFIQECLEIHGGIYDYSKTKYTGKANKVIITCKEHGDFEQKAESHRGGSGCPTCGIKKAHTHYLQTTEDFIRKSKEAHGDTYDYSSSEYTGKDQPIIVTCKKHGPFLLKKAWHHYLGHPVGCQKCSNSGVSKQELEVRKYIESILPEFTTSENFDVTNPDIIYNSRSFIAPLEIDILIPSKNIAIEYNGTYWHSEQAGKDRDYHLKKTEAVEAKGFKLIQIMEYEWQNSQEVVKSRLAHILGKSTKKYFARKLTLQRVTRFEADEFFTRTHIQGRCAHSQAYGLYDGTTLVACMSFGINRFTKDGDMELIRYSTDGNVVGGFSKLLKEFRRNNPNIEALTSYSDRRWSQGGVYEKNGFKKVGVSVPGYAYVDKEGKKYNRVTCQKHKLPGLLGDKFDAAKTETENMLAAGYVKMFDCGMDKWRLNFI